MSFFNFCCPSKSKKSLAYISDWIDAHSIAFNTLSTAVTSLQTWKDTLTNDIVQIVEDIANTYDYASAIPQLTTMSNDIADLQSGLISLQTFLSDKADKVVPKAVNSIALLDSTGNLVDSGKTIKDILVNHSKIGKDSYQVSIDEDGEISLDGLKVTINLSSGDSLEITPDNMSNLERVLNNPDSTPVQDGDNLITSGAVYKAFEDNPVTSLNIIKCHNISSDKSSISINNNNSFVGNNYNTFLEFISDWSGGIISVFLKGSTISCIATLNIGEEYDDEISDYRYWPCKLTIGDTTYTCSVSEDPGKIYSVFAI